MPKEDDRNDNYHHTEEEEDDDEEHEYDYYSNNNHHHDSDHNNASSSEDEVIVEPGFTDEEDEDDSSITPNTTPKHAKQPLTGNATPIKFLWHNDPITLRLDDKTTPSPMFNNLSLRLSQQRSTCAAVATSTTASLNTKSNNTATNATETSNDNNSNNNTSNSTLRSRRHRPETKSIALFDVPILSFVNTSSVCTIMPSPEDKVQHRQPRLPHSSTSEGDFGLTVPVASTPSILGIPTKTQSQSSQKSAHVSEINSPDEFSPSPDHRYTVNTIAVTVPTSTNGNNNNTSRNGIEPYEQETEYALSNITKGLTFQGEALYVSKWLNLGPTLGQVIIVGSHRTIRVCRIHETDSEFTSTIIHESDISTIAAPAIPHAAPFACAACAVSSTRGSPGSALVLVATNIGVIRTFEISRIQQQQQQQQQKDDGIVVTERDIHTHMKNILCMTSAGCCDGGLSIPVAGADEVGTSGADWACANDVGIIAVWGKNSAGGWSRVAAFAPPSQDPCTSLAFHPTCPAVIAAYASGHLRVYSLESHALALEIAAHARPIMGMDTIACLGRPIVVTAAEDTWIRGWSLPSRLVVHSMAGAGGAPDEERGCRQRMDLESLIRTKGRKFVTPQEELVLSYQDDRVTQIFCTHKRAKMWTGVQLLEQQPVPMLAAVAYDDPHLYLYIPQE